MFKWRKISFEMKLFLQGEWNLKLDAIGYQQQMDLYMCIPKRIFSNPVKRSNSVLFWLNHWGRSFYVLSLKFRNELKHFLCKNVQTHGWFHCIGRYIRTKNSKQFVLQIFNQQLDLLGKILQFDGTQNMSIVRKYGIICMTLFLFETWCHWMFKDVDIIRTGSRSNTMTFWG